MIKTVTAIAGYIREIIKTVTDVAVCRCEIIKTGTAIAVHTCEIIKTVKDVAVYTCEIIKTITNNGVRLQPVFHTRPSISPILRATSATTVTGDDNSRKGDVQLH